MPAAPKIEASNLIEGRFWRAAEASWQPLFGGFFTHGISVEWHDFHLHRDLEWSRSFHPGSLEICLNFSGTAAWGDRLLGPGEVAVYTVGARAERAVRKAGSLHRFITIEVSREYLGSVFAGKLELLKREWRTFAEGLGKGGCCLEIAGMGTALLGLRQPLLQPPVPGAARESWYQAKVLEILAHVAFREEEPAELFCQRHQRQSRERVERARYLLERDLENPPSLEMLAQEAGCSTFHLSRIFAEQVGMSIPKFLRTRRIELAAEYLRGGTMNVTQAAMAVGYSSLSAFNKAFVEQMGCCPGLYPVVRVKAA
jgi:AraC-like DNA-binding protein